jgi:hypothetical protein
MDFSALGFDKAAFMMYTFCRNGSAMVPAWMGIFCLGDSGFMGRKAGHACEPNLR